MELKLRLLSLFTLDILISKKMPNDERFLDVAKKIYNHLCISDVIDPAKREKCKIAKFTAEERRHAMIIVQGTKNAFILELTCRIFNNGVYNCPNIRYMSDKIEKTKDLNFHDIELSPNELFELAIKTVSEMKDYDILRNNCQNFVQNYFRALGIDYSDTYLEGEVTDNVLRFLSRPIICFCFVFPFLLFGKCEIILSEYHSFMISFIAITCLILFVLFLYSFFYRHILSTYFLALALLSCISLNYTNIYFYLILLLFILIIRVVRVSDKKILFLSIFPVLIEWLWAFFLLSESMLSLFAKALSTATFGAWMGEGNHLNRESTVILPCSMAIILFLVSYWTTLQKYITLSLVFLLFYPKKLKLEYESIPHCVLLLVTVPINSFVVNNSEKDMPSTYFIFNVILLIVSLLKVISQYIFTHYWNIIR